VKGRQYEAVDFKTLEKWISSYVTNWASGNRWARRTAAISLIIPARNRKFLPDILDIADLLLTDQDDLVQKGYGWMLKAASQAHQKEIFDYVIS